MKNSVQIIGNVGSAPEVREFTNGKKVARFSIATHENVKKANGEIVKNTSWHKLVAWGGMAGLVEKHVSKGKQIAIEGKLNNTSYTDQNGEKRYSTEIVVSELVFTSPRPENV
jgi:single-strand DNA-binding protein